MEIEDSNSRDQEKQKIVEEVDSEGKRAAGQKSADSIAMALVAMNLYSIGNIG